MGSLAERMATRLAQKKFAQPEQAAQGGGSLAERMATRLAQKKFSQTSANTSATTQTQEAPRRKLGADIPYAPIPSLVQHDPPSKLGNLARGVSRGGLNLGTGIENLVIQGGEAVGLASPGAAERHAERGRAAEQRFEPLRKASTAASIGHIVGETAPLAIAPQVGAGLRGAVLTNTVLGAAAGGASLPKEGESRLDNAALGGVAGAAGTLALAPVVKGVDAVRGFFKRPATTQLRDASGELTQQGQQALRAAGASAGDVPGSTLRRAQQLVDQDLTPAQALRIAEGEDVGVALTRGQTSRHFGDQQFETESLKHISSDALPLRSNAAESNRRFGEILEEASTATGGRAGQSAQDLGISVREGLEKAKAAHDRRVTQVYADARIRLGDDPIIEVNNLKAALDDAFTAEGVSPAIGAIRNEAKRLGALDADGHVVGKLSAEAAENLRRRIALFAEKGDRTSQHFMGQLKRALDDDAARALGAEGFDTARVIARAGFLKFKDPKLVDAVLNNKLADEDVLTRIASPTIKARDLRAFKDTVAQSTPQGWDDVRAGIVDLIARQSRSGRALDEAGEPILSGTKMLNALDKIGEPKLKILFDPKELQAIRQIGRVLNTTTNRVPGSVNSSNTSSALINRLTRTISAIPGANFTLQPLFGALRAIGIGIESNATRRGVQEALDPIGSLGRRNRAAKRQQFRDDLSEGRRGVRPRSGAISGAAAQDE